MRVLTSYNSTGMWSYMYSLLFTWTNWTKCHPRIQTFLLLPGVLNNALRHAGHAAVPAPQKMRNASIAAIYKRKSIFLLYVVGCCNTPCTSEGPQSRPHAFTCQTRKSTTAPLNPYHAISLLIRSPLCYEVCMWEYTDVPAHVEDSVIFGWWIFKVSVGAALTSCYLSNRGKETEREVGGLRGCFFDSLLAYATWALRDNLQCKDPAGLFAITAGLVLSYLNTLA